MLPKRRGSNPRTPPGTPRLLFVPFGFHLASFFASFYRLGKNSGSLLVPVRCTFSMFLFIRPSRRPRCVSCHVTNPAPVTSLVTGQRNGPCNVTKPAPERPWYLLNLTNPAPQPWSLINVIYRKCRGNVCAHVKFF